MKEVLVAGYGNIGKALEKISQYHGLDYKFVFIDHNLNCSIEEYLRSRYDGCEGVLINLTGAPSREIMVMCDERKINYIDTGIEVDTVNGEKDVIGAFEAFKSSQINTKAIIGAGMNPGIIEVIYRKYKPDYPHAVIEVEVDTAKSIGSDKTLFNTWCSYSLYSEFCLDDSFLYHGKVKSLNKCAKELVIDETFCGETVRFNIVPHEEIISMAQSSEHCSLSAFLYSPPVKITDYLINTANEVIQREINDVSVFDNISGRDCIGILICDTENLQSPSHYYFNCADHQKCFEKYGVNGTNWQVACGVLAALNVIDSLEAGKPYTMTDIADKHYQSIIEFLTTLGFHISYKTPGSSEGLINKLREVNYALL